MPTLFWRFALLFLAQINIPIRHFFFFSQKQCIRVKHKPWRTTIVHNNFATTLSLLKLYVFYGAVQGLPSGFSGGASDETLQLAEFAALISAHAFLDLGAGVHDERTVLDERLFQGGSGQEDEMRVF